MTPSEAIEAEVAALTDMSLEALRDVWRSRFGPAPKLRSPELLRLQIAWRIQAAHYGGLDAETRRLLRTPTIKSRRAEISPGDRLIREWEGVRHEVVAVQSGFVYGGRTYRSLSQIARAITGVRWNGPRFFGLRPKAKA